ncbi:hypothetical protein ACKKBG_A28735 [Auxenochlorella protothecoides x Auxenochlorella symbiontica]
MASPNPLLVVELQGPDGSSAKIHAQGATLTSWITPDGVERLFVSSKAKYQAGSAIRGGVPICWPQFAMRGPLTQQHGFARTSTWTLASCETASVVFSLDETSAALPADWTAAFHLEMEVRLGHKTMTQELRVTNRGDSNLTFTTALHTYLAVRDIRAAGVRGLRALQYQDNTRPGQALTEEEEVVVIQAEVDRLYVQAPDRLVLEDGADGRRTLTLAKQGFPDVVVWNPDGAKASGMADLSDWHGFLCIEVAHAARDPVVLKPGETWAGRQVLGAEG